MQSMAGPSSPELLNIAVIGGGVIGLRHARAVVFNPRAHLHSLVDPVAHGATTAAAYGTTYHRSIESLLSTSALPDAAIVCTPTSTHVGLSLQLIAAGIHVLVEKLMSTDIASGRELIDAAAAANVKLLAGHHRRFNPYVLAAKKGLESPNIGRVIAVQGIWANKKPTEYYEGNGKWRSGGVVLINMIHEVDLLQYMLGPIEYVCAIAAPKTRNFEAEEGAAIIFRFQSGVVGTFILSDAVPSPWNFEAGTGENPMIPVVSPMAGAGGFYRIMGTAGSLSVPDLTLWHYGGGHGDGNWTDALFLEDLDVDQNAMPFDLQVEHLVDVVLDGAEVNCSGDEALRAMVVCEAIKTSMVTEKPVEIF